MWVIGENGNAVNLAQAQTLSVSRNYENKFEVIALLADYSATLKKFDTEDEACAYIKSTVADLNADRIKEVAKFLNAIEDSIYALDY